MLEFIAANLPIIICFVIGIGLLILEAFMPGFGAPGITGVVLEVITLVMTWFEHGPVATLAMLLIVLLVLAIAISTSLRSITSGRLSKSSLDRNAFARLPAWQDALARYMQELAQRGND